MPNSVVCVSEDGARPFYATIPVSVKLPERSDGADLVRSKITESRACAA